ncbi:hypothetical protein C5167_017708 [Papaver somniferum]|uniref:Pentatricopeptide repeat-containing protein n=1 Tax=Papaver somniferum TaxID=3469 RepID=A0A4Y7IK74_PAPSO|nr:hypothetical protein C5167_017708 [Papaver somniferum]
MIHFYASCANLGFARKLFDELYQPNDVTWNALISGYVQNGFADDGLRVFHLMHFEGIRPDDVTVIGVILACAQKKELDLGRWLFMYDPLPGPVDNIDLMVHLVNIAVIMALHCCLRE